MRRIVHLSRVLLPALALGCAVALGAGCKAADESSGPYEGTVGDAMIDLIRTVDEIADILSDVETVDDCESVKASLAARVQRLRDIYDLVGDFSSETWERMPSRLADSRRAATRHFSAEAVRVMLDNRRARVLRDVIRDIPDLISFKPKAGESGRQ